MEMTSDVAFSYLDDMQKRVMSKDSRITLAEFYAQSHCERVEYYNWMVKQDSSIHKPPLWC